MGIACQEKCLITNCYSKACYHHVKTKGSGGSDHFDNLVPFCFRHHAEVHQLGHLKMSNKYPEFAQVLESKGWEICLFKDRWVNYSEHITKRG